MAARGLGCARGTRPRCGTSSARSRRCTPGPPPTGSARPPAPPPTTSAPAAATALDDAQRKLLAEALRRAEETRDAVEGALVGLGRWLLVQVFDDDAAAALDGRHQNPVWRELLRRAGGPTLRLSERVLCVALHVAAHDVHAARHRLRRRRPALV
ncbi:MAG: hypothetical protein HY909_09600 [Deltaproteobacteria bacterium]|nr:hypothetical protein [Deltaproteobacteria bacterium]